MAVTLKEIEFRFSTMYTFVHRTYYTDCRFHVCTIACSPNRFGLSKYIVTHFIFINMYTAALTRPYFIFHQPAHQHHAKDISDMENIENFLFSNGNYMYLNSYHNQYVP